MAKFDPQAFHAAYERNEAQACGGNAITAMMVAAREMGADTAVVLAQTNSNDVTGERGGYVVGYSAVSFVESHPQITQITQRGTRKESVTPVESAASPGKGESSDLTELEQKSLLGIARSTIESYVRTGKIPEARPLTPKLSEKRGAFVTLHERGQLRGCIGYIEAVKPLYQAVSNMAVAASTEDPRFPPVEPAELDKIEVEITVLSQMRQVPSPDSVVVGRHGVVIKKDTCSAVFLPQVPVEMGWDRNTYLSELCGKAILPRDAWKSPDAKLFVFTGQVFGEKELGRQQ
jgi:AmmeMemoRadiSam system protein A